MQRIKQVGRSWSKALRTSVCWLVALAVWVCAEDRSTAPATGERIEFGVISDVHHGVINWAYPGTGYVELDFVRAFLADMREHPVDFIIQLGDFCKPSDGQPMLDLWNTFVGPRFHVLGNHERDGGFTFDAVAAWWGIPGRYYTFDQGPIRGVVLDANEPGGGGQGYAAYIGPEQQAWLSRQLAASDRPVILFVHQPLEIIRNSAEVMAVLEQAEQKRPGGVLAVFSGHLHQDYVEMRFGIPFIQINSASYVWFGSPGPVRFGGPLWARVVIDFAEGELRLQGRQTTWLTDDVWERGGTEAVYPRDRVRPAISDRRLPLRAETVALAQRLRLTGP